MLFLVLADLSIRLPTHHGEIVPQTTSHRHHDRSVRSGASRNHAEITDPWRSNSPTVARRS